MYILKFKLYYERTTCGLGNGWILLSMNISALYVFVLI
ncbi:unnamed protein product [Coffea canephora]|uniref:Uncharacterized protein n=1 Tax=Coffea canephora TaxID=49390 RepID=A0A068U782_COFCA|nr:unnamed protein product [Coffea canephora]